MILSGALSLGSGAVNEDACGWLGSIDDIAAAWVLDGVTGINDTTLPGIANDAAWFAARTDHHLRRLLPLMLSASDLVSTLVDALIADLDGAQGAVNIPDPYDPPAACLMLARRIESGWEAIRLGDSCLLARAADSPLIRMVDFPNAGFDAWFAAESHTLRLSGETSAPEIRKILAKPLLENRRRRNRPGFYGVLTADRACLNFVEMQTLGYPQAILLATDGFFRLTDTYRAFDEDQLLSQAAPPGGIPTLMQRLRAIEAADPACMTYPRHKPSDDATAVALIAA